MGDDGDVLHAELLQNWSAYDERRGGPALMNYLDVLDGGAFLAGLTDIHCFRELLQRTCCMSMGRQALGPALKHSSFRVR